MNGKRKYQMNSYYKAIHKIISGYNSFFNKKCPYIMDLYAALIIGNKDSHFHADFYSPLYFRDKPNF